MLAATIYSDFGAQKIKPFTVSIVSPSIFHEVIGPDAVILVFWMLHFKPTFSLSSFTFIRRLFSSSKPGLENFEHYFASMWNECSGAVVWTFFGISFLWDCNENWQSCGHCWVFQIRWHIEFSTLTASSFRTWNNPSGIPSPPLALFIVMLPKAYLTSDS